MDPGDATVISLDGLDALISELRRLGYRTRGPVVRDGAIVPGEVMRGADLPVGYHDEQSSGRYRLRRDDRGEVFGWAVGPGSWKADVLPPRDVLWRARSGDGDVDVVDAGPPDSAPVALIGARPCELAASAVLDRVLSGGAVPDPRYGRRRAGAFVVVAECGSPAGTCFCPSMGSGPEAGDGYDLAVTELTGEHDPARGEAVGDGQVADAGGHRFLVRAGTRRGADVLAALPGRSPNPADTAARDAVLARAAASMGRQLDTDGLADLLARNSDHPRWAEVAERCLACGNCTQVCPTCFCTDVQDTTDIAGVVQRTRSWSSCFDLDHSYLHGGPVRRSVGSRYRQWMTHKLSTWWQQFDTSGCVGCGRCVTWCPVGIDITEEAAAIRASDQGGRPGSDQWR
jgi:ferredoxin